MCKPFGENMKDDLFVCGTLEAHSKNDYCHRCHRCGRNTYYHDSTANIHIVKGGIPTCVECLIELAERDTYRGAA